MTRSLAALLFVAVTFACFSEENTTGGEAASGADTSAGATSATSSTNTAASVSESDATGSASASASSTESVDGSTSESAGSSTTGTPAEDPYGQCFAFALGGCGFDEQCAEGCLRNFDDDLQACSWNCGVAAPCPEPLGGDAPAICDPTLNKCVLDCSAGQECPTGMVCDAITNTLGGQEVMACAWPTTEWLPPYTHCFDRKDEGCGRCSLTPNSASSCATDSEPACPDPHMCSGVCLPNCDNGFGDCPAPPDGTAPAVCTFIGEGLSFCLIDCAQGECPKGMQCEEWNVNGTLESVCMWPPPA